MNLSRATADPAGELLDAVLALLDAHFPCGGALETAEILSIHDIEPNKTYWRNTQRAPGRWPGAL